MKCFFNALIIAVLVFPGSYPILSGQSKRQFRTWVEVKGESRVKKGYLSNLGDASVSLMTDLRRSDSDVLEIPVKRIERMKFRRQERPGKFFTFGVISGLVIGGVIASQVPEPTGCSQNTLQCTDPRAKYIFYGLTTGLGLGGIGAALGTLRISIPINRDPATYRRARKKMERFQISNQN